MFAMSPMRFRTLMTLFLLLAACGLAGSFVMDALCGPYIVTEHECQERQLPGADVLADCCCTHPSFVPLASVTPPIDLPLAARQRDGAAPFGFSHTPATFPPASLTVIALQTPWISVARARSASRA